MKVPFISFRPMERELESEIRGAFFAAVNVFMNSNIRPDIYEWFDTLTLEGKEELLAYIKADIDKAKKAPRKSYLEENWAEIKRLMNVLKHEPYIDDQIEIEEIWNICEEMISGGRLADEPWKVRKRLIKSIVSREYYDDYGVYDPMKDLFGALIFTPEEKLEIAELGLKKCRDDQTDLIIFLLKVAASCGDEEWEAKLLRSARLRQKVNTSMVMERLE